MPRRAGAHRPSPLACARRRRGKKERKEERKKDRKKKRQRGSRWNGPARRPARRREDMERWTDVSMPPLLPCAWAYGEPQPQARRRAPSPPPERSAEEQLDCDPDDLIKPRKLLNPVKSSRSHQELHRELMSSCRRSGGAVRVEINKPELERVLECRRRDQLMRERKREEEARRKISPLEAELRKRQRALEEMEAEERRRDERDESTAPEFVTVKANLRRTSCAGKDEKPP